MLYSMLDTFSEMMLDPFGNFPAENSMTVTNGKKVSSAIFSEMRHHQILVLIDFVRIFGAVTCFCSKGEFSYAIIKLLETSRYFFSNVLL